VRQEDPDGGRLILAKSLLIIRPNGGGPASALLLLVTMGLPASTASRNFIAVYVQGLDPKPSFSHVRRHLAPNSYQDRLSSG
jgi:hypothetical protein